MNLLELFISLGYTEEEYLYIRNDYTFRRMTDETMYNNVLRNYNWLVELYGKSNVIKITKNSPMIYGLNIENMNQKINFLMELGYSRADVIKITKKYPIIYGINTNTIKQIIKYMELLGYNENDEIEMIKLHPSLLGYDMANIKKKIKDIAKLGYSYKEVIKMTKNCPQLYGYSIENIREKIGFYDSINMHELAVKPSMYLMQSVNLSYARYCFYQDKGINITMDNHAKLFCSDKAFEKIYGTNKKELMEKYDYNKYFMEKKNGRVI